MSYTPITPFRRAVTAAHLKPHLGAQSPLPAQGVNKWESLRELAVARTAFGLSDRDLTVLQALVSFHPGAVLGDGGAAPVIHPSNKAICERLNGMPCSTMRRHLGHLVAAGLVTRRDSPNGKRYTRRVGAERVVFGFDLSPLVVRHGEICAEAEALRAAQEAHARLRERVSLMRRDLAGLVGYGAQTRPDLSLWQSLAVLAADCAQALRRKLSVEGLEALSASLLEALRRVRAILEPDPDTDMSTNGTRSEQHCQNSKTDSYDSDLCLEKQEAAECGADPAPDPDSDRDLSSVHAVPDPDRPALPLGLVLSACPEVQSYTGDPIRHWHQLVAISETLRPMLGISPSAWQDAKTHMGPEQAAVVLAAMLERVGDIHSPGGYLRALSRKAAAGQFSCGPMVMSLLHKTAA